MGIYNNDEAVAFLRENGYVGTYNDMMLAWLRDVFAVNTYTLNDLLKRYEAIYGKEFNVFVVSKSAVQKTVTCPAVTFTSTTPSDGGSGTTVLTSAGTHALTAANAVGDYIDITAGTGWTAGQYQITAIDLDTTGVAITIDVPYDAGMGSPTISLVGDRATILTVTIPALLANSMVKIDHSLGSNDTNSKVHVIDLEGQDIFAATYSTSEYGRRETVFHNRNDTSVQVRGFQRFASSSNGATGVVPGTTTVDTSVPTTLRFCVELSTNDSDGFIDRYIIEVYK
jgi:hypothetical protein